MGVWDRCSKVGEGSCATWQATGGGGGVEERGGRQSKFPFGRNNNTAHNENDLKLITECTRSRPNNDGDGCVVDNITEIKRLIEDGATVNCFSQHQQGGKSPLSIACEMGHARYATEVTACDTFDRRTA